MLEIFSKIPFFLFGTNISKAMSEIKIVRKPKYDGRIKKRKWEERRIDKGEGLNPENSKTKIIKKETEITSDLIERIKRRKFAILLGYSGVDYFGMQRNPYTRTIEEEFFQALLNNNYITEEAFTQVQTLQFQRAARTDKGVSAARQIVSIKLPENVDIKNINTHLPEVIRIFGIKRVTKGFNSKVQCDGRTYIYIMPTVAFIPRDQLMVQKGFRLDQAIHKKVNDLLQHYLGTKNYHNFTSKKKPLDPSAKRYMKSFVCEAPFIKNDVEFTVLKVHGQSFMLHQIRKMVGLIIGVIKGCTGEKTIELAFTTEKVNIPRAPGLGLVLDYVHYERYNNRYGTDGMHESLTWDEVEEQVNEFKEKYIYPTIINTELKEESMICWVVRKLLSHEFDNLSEDKEEKDDEIEDDEHEEEKSDDEKIAIRKT